MEIKLLHDLKKRKEHRKIYKFSMIAHLHYVPRTAFWVNSHTIWISIFLFLFRKQALKLKCRYVQQVIHKGIWKWQSIFEMWVSGSGPIIHKALEVERAREQERSEMCGGNQSLGPIFYSGHVHSPLHLSVPSNNSSVLAACLPACQSGKSCRLCQWPRKDSGRPVYICSEAAGKARNNLVLFGSLLVYSSATSVLWLILISSPSPLWVLLSHLPFSLFSTSLSPLTGESLTLPQQRVSTQTHMHTQGKPVA